MNTAAQTAPELRSPLGLVAGNGRFPVEFVENAKAKGLEVVVLALKGEADPVLESMALSCTWVGVGQLGKIIKVLKRAGCQQVAFAGGVRRVNFVDGFRIDWVGLKMLSRLRSFNDDSLLRGIIHSVESKGVSVIAASCLLEKSVVRAGQLTSRGLTAEELADACIGWGAARAIGDHDIGQSVIVRNKTIIAVEAVEGTDAVIQRSALVRGKGGVLIKLAKSIQDLRIDMPAIGVQTIERMHESRLTALVIEANKTIMLDPQAVLQAAAKVGIAIVAASELEQLG
jgi:DUF1009 family protein